MSLTDVHLPRPRPDIVPALVRTRERPASVAVGTIVAVATALRFLADLRHTTTHYFPDEYLYATLARSLGHGTLEIRGEHAHFPALLESVVTAPIWLAGGVETPYRLVQLLHALLAGLTAVPVFVLASRLGLSRGRQVACAALTPALPVFVFSAYLTADTLGALLALSALAAGTGCLVQPARRRELAFLALAVLATAARFQYVILFPAFVAAVLTVERGRLRRAVRSYPFLIAALAAAAAVVLAAGPSRLLGYYDSLLDFHVSVPGMAKWAATDLLFVAYASGVVLGPLAAVGLVGALARPRSAAERAFAALAGAFVVLVLGEAVLYATNGSARFQERYFMAVLPLVAPLAFLGLRRIGERRARLALAGMGAAMLAAAASLSISGYLADDGDQDSPLLQAVTWIDHNHGAGAARLAVTVLVTGAVLLAAAALRKRRADSVLAIAATVVVLASAFAIAEDARRADDTRAFSLAPDARWVDHSGLGAVSALVPRDALRWVVSEQLFWNRSVDRVLTLPGAPDADAFQNDRVHVDDRGVLRSGSRAVTGPLLVEEYAAFAQLENARLVARVATTSLWAPQAGTQARFVSLTEGRYLDGWLGWPSGRVTVWPGAGGSRTGVLCLPLSVPDFGAAATQTVELSAPGYRARVTVPSGGTRLVAVPRTVRGPWVLKIAAVRPLRIGPRLLSVKVSNPRFVTGKASASACR